MGRSKSRASHKGGVGNKRVPGDGTEKPKGRDDAKWKNIPLDNERFCNYYKLQEIVPEDEWDAFVTALKTDLPTTFRITGCREIAAKLHQLIKDTYVPFLTGLEIEGVPLLPPKSLSWYPDGFAWQLNVSKGHIRKNEAFKKFQHFLVYETDAGNISRQEAVSMIPPLLLDVLPHHCVLDVCAAPGSKSVQLLEALHMLPTDGSAPVKVTGAKGLLIANDSDAKRCHMLVHQSLHRIPATAMMVTNHDACQLPGLRIPANMTTISGSQLVDVEGEGEKEAQPSSTGPKWRPLLFDRILADVPCSGDGTLRKNVGIWKDWNVGQGAGLHPLQLRILLRAIALLKPGGRLVYSTCSMNPIENEAVVSAALEICPEMSLVAVPDKLPNLVRRPGLTSWKVLDNANRPAPQPGHAAVDVEDDSAEVDSGGKKVKRWTPTFWPNGKEAERGLDRCIRIYPHLQDTGAFFVAVLIKADVAPRVDVSAEMTMEEAKSAEAAKRTASERTTSPVPEQPSAKKVRVDKPVEAEVAPVVVEESKAVVPTPKVIASPFESGARQPEFKEEPYIYLSPEDEQVKTCLEFFELSPDFPVESLLVRNAQGLPLRQIYFTSPLVRALLLSNSHARMRLISCGVKLFSRQDSGKDGTYRCKWRVISEGLEVLRPFMGPRRIIKANVAVLRVLMTELNVPFVNLEGLHTAEEEGEGGEAFLERLKAMEPGSCVLEVVAKGDGVALEQNLVLPLWRSVISTSLMVEKTEKSALSLRLFGVDITPHRMPEKARDVKAAADAALAASGASTPALTEVSEEGTPVGAVAAGVYVVDE